MLITTADFAALVGVSLQSINSLSRSPLRFKPIKRGSGRTPASWELSQALAVLTARGLRKRGVNPDDCETVLRTLWALGEKKLKENFAAGKTHLMIVSDRCNAELLPLGAITWACSQRDLGKHGLEASAVNVLHLWNELESAAVKMKSTPDKAKRYEPVQN